MTTSSRPGLKQFLRLLILLTLNACGLTQQVHSCVTPRSAAGACVPENDCVLITELQSRFNTNKPPRVQQYLTNSLCLGPNNQVTYYCCELNHININAFTRLAAAAARSSSAKNEIIFADTGENFESQLNRNGVQLLRNIQCGISNINYISFGEVAKLAEFPWMALLRYENPSQPFQCSGSLVTQRFVVTAAHCLKNTAYKLLNVRLGEHDIEKESDCITRRKRTICYTAEDFGIEKTITHHNYNSYTNDIGLIKLDRDVEFKSHISPICLPLFNHLAQAPAYPDRFTIAGWGTTEISDKTAKKLLKAQIPPKPRSYCEQRTMPIPIEKVHICAGGENRTDTCSGDSGGPLFATSVYENTARFVLYGVVSFGAPKCGDVNPYGVYTNVVQYMPWITQKILE